MNTKKHENQQNEVADAAKLAEYRVLIQRMPLTLRPSLNGQLAEWATLFRFERLRVMDFLNGVALFAPSEFQALFSPLRELEEKMGVQKWNFSESADTMENASLLARSEFYAAWRNEVQRIYHAAEAASHTSVQKTEELPRLIIAILPESLPFERSGLWSSWADRGAALSIDGDPTCIVELLMQGIPSIPNFEAQSHMEDNSDSWLIDAGTSLQTNSSSSFHPLCLSYPALNAVRERVLAQVNAVPRSIEMTDHTLTAIRSQSWDPWWPTDLNDQPALRRFVIDLYLSGNGALIFSNAFVEWAASEAIRRARPRLLIARFGLRAKPKPFTGIAIFENPKSINTLPDEADPHGSAIDAMILARYIQFSAQRYHEAAQTAFLCIAEAPRSAYLILPQVDQPRMRMPDAATPEKIVQWLIQHLST
jgi:hypothetical protein